MSIPVEPDNPQSEHYNPNNTIPFKRFDPNSLPLNFQMSIVLQRRGAKTTAVESMLEEFKKQNRFTHYFLISQTLSGFVNQIPETYRFTNTEVLPPVIKRQQEITKFNKKQKNKDKMKKSNILFILDDIIGDGKDVKNSVYLRKLAVQGRHITAGDPLENETSIIIITQSLTAIPRVIRLQNDATITGRVSSKPERKMYVEEFSTLKTDREGMKEAYSTIDNIVLSHPYRLAVSLNYKPNKRVYTDFIEYYDGNLDKRTHLFGDKYDWQVERQDIEF